jgi:aspartate 4-decarboxylase
MRYFASLRANRLLRRGDTIALGSPIFTPCIELLRLEDYDLSVVEIAQNRMADGRHGWQYSGVRCRSRWRSIGRWRRL